MSRTLLLLIIIPLYLFSHEEETIKLLRVVSSLTSCDPDCVEIIDIKGGATNHNFGIFEGSNKYFLRISSQNASILESDSYCELLASELAAKKGIAPAVIFSHKDENLLVFAYLDAADTYLNINDQRIISNFRNIHTLPKKLTKEFSFFATINHYLIELDKMEFSLYGNIFASEALDVIKPHLKEEISSICHLDLHRGNFLDDGQKLWVVDWEYAALADPIADLAIFSSTENLSDSGMRQLLHSYREDAGLDLYIKLYLMRILADIRWGLWCYIQINSSSIELPYEKLAKEFFDHALERYDSPFFQSLLISD